MGEVKNYRALLKWIGTFQCLFVDFLFLYTETTRLFLSFTVLLFTLKIHNLHKNLGEDRGAISYNTCEHAHTYTNRNAHRLKITPLTVTVAQVGHVSLFNILLERQSAEEKRHGH